MCIHFVPIDVTRRESISNTIAVVHIARVDQKKIRIPPLQRGNRWKVKHALAALLESILDCVYLGFSLHVCDKTRKHPQVTTEEKR